jgi:hypothetical protein
MRALRRNLAANVRNSILEGFNFQDLPPAGIQLSGASLSAFCRPERQIGPKWVCNSDKVYRAVSAPLIVTDSEFENTNTLVQDFIFTEKVVLARNRFPGSIDFSNVAFLQGLDLSGSTIGRFVMSDAAVQGTASFKDIQSNRLFNLGNLVVNGDLSLARAVIRTETLNMSSLAVEGHLDLSEMRVERGLNLLRILAAGGVVLKSALLDGRVYLSDLDAGLGDLRGLRLNGDLTASFVPSGPSTSSSRGVAMPTKMVPAAECEIANRVAASVRLAAKPSFTRGNRRWARATSAS